MKKRFIVCIDNSTKEQNEKFSAFIREQGVGWWHWLSNAWLIADSSGKLSASQIRDELKTFFDGEHTIVIELKDNGDTWAGFGPKSDAKDMFKWLKKNWSK